MTATILQTQRDLDFLNNLFLHLLLVDAFGSLLMVTDAFEAPSCSVVILFFLPTQTMHKNKGKPKQKPHICIKFDSLKMGPN